MIEEIKKKHSARYFFYGLLSGWLLLAISCASTSPANRYAAPDKNQKWSPGGRIFQSEEYIVYRLEGTETLEMLAAAFLKDSSKAWVVEDENRNVPFKKGQRIVIPLKDHRLGGLSADGYQVVPILCYHGFREKCEKSLCLSGDAFIQQMEYLKRHQYRVIGMKELLGFLRYRQGLPDRAVAITFDDGYRSFYEKAYPVLKNYGYKATLFVYTDFIGNSPNALTWDQLRKLAADGYEIGSHGLSHIDLTQKKEGEDETAYLARIRDELVRSKEILDRKLNQDTAYIAFPYGSYNQKIIQLCEKSGYEIGLSVEGGGNPFFADPLALRRDQIMNNDLKKFIFHLKTFNRLAIK